MRHVAVFVLMMTAACNSNGVGLGHQFADSGVDMLAASGGTGTGGATAAGVGGAAGSVAVVTGGSTQASYGGAVSGGTVAVAGGSTSSAGGGATSVGPEAVVEPNRPDAGPEVQVQPDLGSDTEPDIQVAVGPEATLDSGRPDDLGAADGIWCADHVLPGGITCAYALGFQLKVKDPITGLQVPQACVGGTITGLPGGEVATADYCRVTCRRC